MIRQQKSLTFTIHLDNSRRNYGYFDTMKNIIILNNIIVLISNLVVGVLIHFGEKG